MNNTRLGDWHILGAGRIGTLAAHYLQRAGATVCVVRPDAPARQQQVTLEFADGPRLAPHIVVRTPADCPRIRQLLVATKIPYTRSAFERLDLADNATIIRLQNGIGSLDGLLAPGQRLIEGVTASAVMASDAPDRIRVIAENASHFGGGVRPGWFDTLAAFWPDLHWATDIRPIQWQKLVANAAINPLTAVHDVPNGALLECDPLYQQFCQLIDESDGLLSRLHPSWPGDSRSAVESVVRATAGNTSSMRADAAAGTATEIDSINGWLLGQAKRLNYPLPTHAEIIARVRAMTPS